MTNYLEDSAAVTLTIAIKCFNEERKIANAIQSAIAACAECNLSAEVLVADSLSTDQTIAIASRFPVRVVQLVHESDRGCGTGVQLSFQHALGEFVYFMDGDMTLESDFLQRAIECLRSESGVAGVGGLLTDTQETNAFDKFRRKNKPSATSGEVLSLGGGGLYKRAAIIEAGGYAADLNLKGYEEAELGMRLRSRGWRLLRLPVPAIRHTGHDMSTSALLLHHWRTGRAMAGGVLLRSAIAKPWRWDAIRLLIHPLATLAWWLTFVLAVAVVSPTHRTNVTAGFLGIAAMALFGLLLRKKSLSHVATSVTHWHYGALALLIGLTESQRDPSARINAIELPGSGPR